MHLITEIDKHKRDETHDFVSWFVVLIECVVLCTRFVRVHHRNVVCTHSRCRSRGFKVPVRLGDYVLPLPYTHV